MSGAGLAYKLIKLNGRSRSSNGYIKMNEINL